MKKAWRFRTSFFGVLILQRCVKYNYIRCSIESSTEGNWRDATAKDLLIYVEEC